MIERVKATTKKKNQLPQISNEYDVSFDYSRGYEVVWIMETVQFGDSKAARSRGKVNRLKKSE